MGEIFKLVVALFISNRIEEHGVGGVLKFLLPAILAFVLGAVVLFLIGTFVPSPK